MTRPARAEGHEDDAQRHVMRAARLREEARSDR